MRRRDALLTALAAAALPVAGCGSGDQAGTTTVRLLTPIFEGITGKRTLEAQLARYRARHPGVRVEVDYSDYDNLNQKLTTAAASGRPYDVMMLGVGWVPPFASRGVLADLGTSVETLAGRYPRRAVEGGTYQGRVYALPVMLDTRYGVYRRDVFAEAGLDRPPRDFAELREYARLLTRRDENGRLLRAGFDFLSLDLRQGYLTMLWAAGGELFDASGERAVFNSAAGVRALETMVRLVREDRALDVGFTKVDDVNTAILHGRSAMAIAHNNLWRAAKKQNPRLLDEERLGTFLISDARPAMFVGGTLAAMSAQTRRPGLARDLVELLADPVTSLAASQQRGNVPAVTSLTGNGYVRTNPFVRFPMANMAHGHVEGGTTAWLAIRSGFKPAIESALLGRKTPRQALDDLVAKAVKAQRRG